MLIVINTSKYFQIFPELQVTATFLGVQFHLFIKLFLQ